MKKARLTHISEGYFRGKKTTIFSIQRAIKDDVEFIVKLDQVTRNADKSSVIIFDFSEVSSFEGSTVGLPMAHILGLKHLGYETFVILSDAAREYLRKRRILDVFKEIKKNEVEFDAVCAA